MAGPSYDLIVVGAGNAGLCGALAAGKQGAKVLVLERAPRNERGGNTAFAAGGFRVVYHGLEDVRKFVDLSEKQIAPRTSRTTQERTQFSKGDASHHTPERRPRV